MTRRNITRASRKKKNFTWAAALVGNNTALAAAAFDQTTLFEGADFQGGDTGQASATITRIIGWLSFVVNSAADTTLFAVILKLDENDLATGDFDPTSIVTYVDEDVLWSGGVQWEASSTESHTMRIDIKTKRVIARGKQIRLILKATGGPILLSGVLRTLAQKG